jgi:hypothetical protein
VDEFAAGLTNRRKFDELAGHGRTQLLVEFAPGCGEWILAVFDLALRNRPGALVLLYPQGPSRMYEQYLELMISTTK